ncbi:MAG: DEAD/DEAH box helicase [Chloroflexi bacterium]|nr:DEAD/DEAH box helicase [Chloroflexota bacterium]
MRYRGSSKIKHEHSMLPGVRDFLESELESLEYIQTIVPGRIKKAKKFTPGLQIRYGYPVKGGAKILVYSTGAVQEVFVVTSQPEKLRDLEKKPAKVGRKGTAKKNGLSRTKLEQITAEFIEGLGEPEPSPLFPSLFQREALELVLQGDVIVTAPTGSGKTWIAERAVENLLDEGKTCWYTTPLKALSNQKYDNFRRLLGDERVGLLTGERKENPTAPLIVATTEVFRNGLYSGDQRPWLVVLDEAHYLGDEQRGTTWEEVIILALPETRLLLLSATISNVDEIVNWMERVRGVRPYLVKEQERPVPLRCGFSSHTYKYILPLDSGLFDYRRKGGAHFNPVKAVEALEERELLPAIVFLSSRKACDRAASRFEGIPWKDRTSRFQIFAEAAAGNPYLWENRLIGPLMDSGVASHHAGHLTGWKVSVERMLARGELRVVFATTTLAAGLDVPARTVVLPTLLTRDEYGPRLLNTLEFHQMTGRAGRRGMDRIGFVVLDPELDRDLALALNLHNAEPEPIRSAFKVNYHQVLNLLSRFDFDMTLEILERSLLLFQQVSRKDFRGARAQLGENLRSRIDVLQKFNYLDKTRSITDFGRWALLIRHENSLILTELIRRSLCRSLSASELAGWVAALTSGRSPRGLACRTDIRPLLGLARELEGLEKKKGIYSAPLSPGEAWRKAASVKLWVEGEAWDRLVAKADVEEGDLQWLLLQTSEGLRQLEDLPLPVAYTAEEARSRLLRMPLL